MHPNSRRPAGLSSNHFSRYHKSSQSCCVSYFHPCNQFHWKWILVLALLMLRAFPPRPAMFSKWSDIPISSTSVTSLNPTKGWAVTIHFLNQASWELFLKHTVETNCNCEQIFTQSSYFVQNWTDTPTSCLSVTALAMHRLNWILDWLPRKLFKQSRKNTNNSSDSFTENPFKIQ